MGHLFWGTHFLGSRPVSGFGEGEDGKGREGEGRGAGGEGGGAWPQRRVWLTAL